MTFTVRQYEFKSYNYIVFATKHVSNFKNVNVLYKTKKYEFFATHFEILKSEKLCKILCDNFMSDSCMKYYNYGHRKVLSYPFDNAIDSFKSFVEFEDLNIENRCDYFFYNDLEYIWLKEISD